MSIAYGPLSEQFVVRASVPLVLKIAVVNTDRCFLVAVMWTLQHQIDLVQSIFILAHLTYGFDRSNDCRCLIRGHHKSL